MHTPTPHSFVWYDLMTPDVSAATDFYTAVIGWIAADSGLTDRTYTLLSANGPAGPAMVAGLMGTPETMKGAPSAWNGHIGVENVDAFAQRVVAAGGKIYRAPEDVPLGIGRFSVVADPGGASFILFCPGNASQGPPSAAPFGTPGFVGWHELHAADGVAAWDFYSDLFGWTRDAAHDMGPMGVYQTFAAGGPAIGGMMTKMPQMPGPPAWVFYINVDSVSAAMERIKAAGGKVVRGPQEVPGGAFIAQAFDPQGAFFAVTSMTR